MTAAPENFDTIIPALSPLCVALSVIGVNYALLSGPPSFPGKV